MVRILTREEIYKGMAREMPDGVFPDGSPTQFISTADTDAVAQTIATSYTALGQVDTESSIITATETSIGKWEYTYFSQQFEGELLEDRRARILGKIRQNEDISQWQIQLVCAAFFPNTWIEVRQRNQLDDETSSMVKGTSADTVWGPTWTSGDAFPSGVTGLEIIRTDVEQMRYAQLQAFIYDIYIFTNDTISTETLTSFSAKLTEQEPARCRHTITITPPENLDFWKVVYDATRYSNAKQLRIGSEGIFRRETLWFGFDEDPDSRGFGDVECTVDEGFLYEYPPTFGFDNNNVGAANAETRGFSDENYILGGTFASVGVVGGGFFFLPELT
jgi:hypothetical protein